MRNDKLKSPQLPPEFYPNDLLVIKNIRFTPRQIDIIACLISGGTGKTISSLLDIEIKTLEAHKKDIGGRIGGGIQEDIIFFVQESDKYGLLKQHYLLLLYKSKFENQLKELAEKVHGDFPVLRVEPKQIYSNKPSIFNLLVNHLRSAGISIISDVRETNVSVYGVQSYILSVMTKSTIRQLKKSKKSEQKFFVILDKEINENIAKIISEIGSSYIDFRDPKNYFSSLGEILNQIYPDANLDKPVSIVGIDNSYALKNFEIDFETSMSKGISLPTTLAIFKKWKKWFLGGGLICISAAGSLTLNNNRPSNISSTSRVSPTDISVRSELPIPIDDTLLKRPELMNQIDKKIKGRNGIRTVALVGPGGAGKTTLARQYAHQQKANVIWEANAETHENLKSSFENLAQALAKTEEERKVLREIQDIKTLTEREEKIIQFVKAHMKSHSNWLFIYDNVEKFSDIQTYFPRDFATWGEGRIILTTRDNNIQNNKHVNDVIQIGELTHDQKLNLFTKTMSQGNTSPFTSLQTEEAKVFLENLPSFPLDVSIAAYYIKATNVPYKRYLERLTQYDNNFENIQENLLRESGNYKSTRYKIITLSINQLIKINKNFEELLLFISLLDSQNIPSDLLIKYKNEVIVDDFIYHLKKYSLIVSRSSSSFQSMPTFSLHRSTQAISLAYLNKSLNPDKIKNNLQSIVNTLQNYVFELLAKSDVEKIKHLINHCEILLTHNTLITHAEKGIVQGSLGCIYYCLCNYEKAQQLLENGLINLNSNRDNSYGLKAQFLAYLGTTNKNLGNFERAKSLLEKSIFIYKTHIPENYDGLVWALSNLGDIYRNLGDVEKAKDLLEQSINIYNVSNSSDYIGRARALVYLGVVYRDLGNYVQSKLMYEQSLKLYQKYLPSDYIRIGRALAHSGNIHRELGNYSKSKELILQSLNIYQQLFPGDHIDIGWVLLYLGNTYRELKEYEEAQKSLQQSLTIYKKHYPEDHIEVALVVFYLGKVYKALNKYQKAKKFITKSLAVFKNYYGEDHTETAKVLRDVGQVNLLEGHTDIAENFLQRSLEIFQKNQHPESYTVLEILTDLYMKKSMQAANKGGIQHSQAFKKQAIRYLQQALEIVKTHFPEDSPHIQRIQGNLDNIT